ncbi:HNH/ENDO VII family nuclease [Faecalibacterium sp. An121]|uniref:HNH/ENDO VII family nuclease n=1 Tax=Faecalibacterium sp. An121 TaxID=1965550 RepID=UPI001302D080|nr:HNH/ENDO VII family nuclease [Faecalibacterium sp. An121]
MAEASNIVKEQKKNPYAAAQNTTLALPENSPASSTSPYSQKSKVFKKYSDFVEWTATDSKGTMQTYQIHQRTDIDWDKIRTTGNRDFIGKTNAVAAREKGLAPELNDGNLATLHHLGQDSRGGLVEASRRYHGVGKPGQNILHSQFGRNKPNPNHPINRARFAYDVKEYWKWREQNR